MSASPRSRTRKKGKLKFDPYWVKPMPPSMQKEVALVALKHDLVEVMRTVMASDGLFPIQSDLVRMTLECAILGSSIKLAKAGE